MNPIFNWIANHQAPAALAGYWVFSALVSGMPQPKETDGAGYVWLYNSLHILASNLSNVFGKKTPSIEMPHVTPQPPEVKQ